MNTYEARVRALEAEGLTRSDAQGVVDAENIKAGIGYCGMCGSQNLPFFPVPLCLECYEKSVESSEIYI